MVQVKLLVIDVGNTSTAVGLWTDGRVRPVGHYDEGVVDLGSFLARRKEEGAGGKCGSLAFDSLDGVAYVSVVPKRDAKWKRSARTFGLPFHQLSYLDFQTLDRTGASRARTHSTIRKSDHSKISSILLDYPKPETIGADRLADAAGAVSRYGAPVLVMDFGTALTAAVVTRDGVWRGGVIAPGFPLMRDYLFERTAKLPRMELGRGRAPKIGRSTEEAMRFGALVGYRGMVREIVATLARNFETDFRLVATGGFAKWALKGAGLPFTVDSTLTLHGAGLLARAHLDGTNGKG